MKVTCMQLGHPSLTKSSGGEGNTQMGLETAVRARGEEGEGRSRLVRFSDFPIFPHARLVACWRRHAASCMSSLAKRWQLQHASGGQRGQLRTGLGVCGSVTAHGFNKDVVARCGVVGKRGTGGCCGAMMGDRGGVRERGRGGEVRNTSGSMDPYSLPYGQHLRSSPSVWRTAAQCPPSRRTQAAMTNHRSCSPCGRYGSWNRPPGCEQAMERSKEKTRTARRVETEWSASCPTALPDHADLPDSSSPPRCSGATVCRSSAPVRQAEQDGSGREKVMISQTPQKRNIAMPCAVDPRVSFSARPESRWPAAVPAAEAVRMRRPWCLLVWG